jgi:Ion channel
VLELATIFLAPLAAKGLPLAAVLVDVLTWTVVVGSSCYRTMGRYRFDFGRFDLPFSGCLVRRGLAASSRACLVTWQHSRVFRADLGRGARGVCAWPHYRSARARCRRREPRNDPQPRGVQQRDRSGPFWRARHDVYFNLVTLTTIGYGDVAPVDRFSGDSISPLR